MSLFKRSVRVLALLVMLPLSQASRLLAHDCSGPDDCEGIPPNIARTTAVTGTIVIGTLVGSLVRRRKNKKDATKPGKPAKDWGLPEKPKIDYAKLYKEEIGETPPPPPPEAAPSADRRPLPGPPPDRPLGGEGGP